MATPIIMFAMPGAAASPAVAYATQLAKAIGVPLQLVGPETGAQAQPLPSLRQHPPAPLARGRPAARLLPQVVAAMLAEPDALLLLLVRPTSQEASAAWLLDLTLSLLLGTTRPVLLVPAQAPSRVPLHLVLAADGEAFRLGPRRHVLHTLLFTLPIHLTVVHVRQPKQAFSEADALQSVLACGLATRCVASCSAAVGSSSSSPAAGILLGAQQAQADLLVLIVRPRSLQMPHFARGVAAALLQQSPVPLLLLPAEA